MQADGDAWDSFRLIEVVQLLKALSLVTTDTHGGFLSVSMHPLTHVWTRNRQAATEQHESWVTTGCLVTISRNEDEFWLQHRLQLQPHLQAKSSCEISKMFMPGPPIKITSILVNCGGCCIKRRMMLTPHPNAKPICSSGLRLPDGGMDWFPRQVSWLIPKRHVLEQRPDLGVRGPNSRRA